MARKPDKRVYVRWNRQRRMIQKRRIHPPTRKKQANRLAEDNLRLLHQLLQQL
ncbi:MAG: hypothetical protein ACUVRD_02495 [Bacteroidia bacterium]